MHVWKKGQPTPGFMEEGHNSRFSWRKIQIIAMESRKVIMCGGMKLYSAMNLTYMWFKFVKDMMF